MTRTALTPINLPTGSEPVAAQRAAKRPKSAQTDRTPGRAGTQPDAFQDRLRKAQAKPGGAGEHTTNSDQAGAPGGAEAKAKVADAPADAARGTQNVPEPDRPEGEQPEASGATCGTKTEEADRRPGSSDPAMTEVAPNPSGAPEPDSQPARSGELADGHAEEAAPEEKPGQAQAQAGEAGVPADKQGRADAPATTIGAKVAAILSAPLTATNLARLLATIDPRLVQAGLAPAAQTVDSVPQPASPAPEAASPQAQSADLPVEQFPAAAANPPEAGLEVVGAMDGQARPEVAPPEVQAHAERARSAETPRTGTAPGATAAPPVAPEVRPVEPRGRAAVSPSSEGRAADVLATGVSSQPGGQGSGAGLRGDLRPAMSAKVLESMPHEPPAGQLARGLAAALERGSGGEVTLRLHPSSLGQVRIAVTVDGRKANVRFTTGNAQARGLLSTSLGSLREALESQGLVIDRLTVEEPRGENPGRTEPTAGAARTDAPGPSPREAPQAQGHGGPTLTAHERDGAGAWQGGRDGSSRDDHGLPRGGLWEGPAGTADEPDEALGGAVLLMKDGVQDPMGRILLRLDALA